MVDPKDVEQFVAMYFGKGGNINPWFTRRLKQAPLELRDAVNDKVRELGLDRLNSEEAQRLAPNRPQKGNLTDEDWEQLSEKVFEAIINHPGDRLGDVLIKIGNKMMSQLPPAKQKKLTKGNFGKLVDNIEKRIAELLEADTLAEQLTIKLQSIEESPKREDVLQSLTDEEILSFKKRFLELITPDEILSTVPEETVLESIPTSTLIGRSFQRAVEMIQESNNGLTGALNKLKEEIERKQVPQKSITAETAVSYVPLPRIAMIGLMATQFQIVASKLSNKAKFFYIDKNMKGGDTIPDNCQYVILWTRHISHAMQDHAKAKCSKIGAELIRHAGGVDTLVRKLETILTK